MVEVFKTNVTEARIAERLIEQIHQNFVGYQANFDLDDCDRILRIKNFDGLVNVARIIALMQQNGFMAEVLADEPTQLVLNTIDALRG